MGKVGAIACTGCPSTITYVVRNVSLSSIIVLAAYSVVNYDKVYHLQN